jgi:lysophospholipase L1-like esterase
MTRKLLRAVVWIVVIYVLLEAGFRLYRYEQLASEVGKNTHYRFSSFKEAIYKVDSSAGYAYLPNSHNRQFLYDENGNLLPHDSRIVTNNMGMFSSVDAQVDKAPDEFRIAILGDSFCATTTSDVVWPTALQDALNADLELKRAVGKSKITVLNFGLDGTGLVQWPDVYRTRAAKFNPDLVIVNFISNDIVRKYVYRDTLRFGVSSHGMFACSSLPVDITNPDCRNGFAFVLDPTVEDPHQKGVEIKGDIYKALLGKLPWYSPYPELLATIFQGHLGLHPRLEVSAFRPGIFGLSNLFYDDEQQSIGISLDALKQISALHQPTLIFHHPAVEECLAGKSSPLAQQFMAAAKGLHIVDMLTELPQGASPDVIRAWYNLPYDAHPSNYGAKLYAESAEKQVRSLLLANSKAH